MARIAALNKQGGIDGHQVSFVGASDDGGSPTTDLSIVKTLILKNHVAAIAPVITTVFSSASATFAAQNKTPYLGWGFVPDFCGSKWGYGFNGCLVSSSILNTSLVVPIIHVAEKKTSGKLTVGLVADNNSTGTSSNALFTKLFNDYKVKVVYQSATMPLTGTVNYAPYVQAILAAHPSIVYLGPSFSQTIAMAAALRDAGYKGLTFDSQTYVPGLLQSEPAVASALKGEFINTQIPPQEENAPATKQISKDLVAIGQSSKISEGEAVGYWTADVLVQALQATARDRHPLTGAGIEQTMNKGFNYKSTLSGGIGPISFPKGETYPEPCAALVTVSGTHYKVVDKFACYQTIKG